MTDIRMAARELLQALSDQGYDGDRKIVDAKRKALASALDERETEADVYAALFRKVNGPSGMFQREFVERFEQEHPTLQQAFVRHVLVPALEVLAATRPDARNQGSHDFAKAALDIERRLPLI